jgi:hypothetical protein
LLLVAGGVFSLAGLLSHDELALRGLGVRDLGSSHGHVTGLVVEMTLVKVELELYNEVPYRVERRIMTKLHD